MSQRTIVKLYKSNCGFDFASPIEIANTPTTIAEQLVKFNAEESDDIYFFAMDCCKEVCEDDETTDVYVSKIFTCGECVDVCDDVYCLLLIEMTEDMQIREKDGFPSFSIDSF